MNRTYNIEDEDMLNLLEDYRLRLIEDGYSADTARGYKNYAGRYIATGRGMTLPEINEYYAELQKSRKVSGRRDFYVQNRRAGAVRFYYYYYASEEEKFVAGRTKGKRKKKTCDEDCFNCRFDDCIWN